MKIFGNFYKDGNFWIIEIPALDLMTQAKRKKDIEMMAQEAIELLDENSILQVNVTAKDNILIIESDDLKNFVCLNTLIPKEKQRLYDSKNKELVKSLKKRIKEEKATIDLGSFKKYIE